MHTDKELEENKFPVPQQGGPGGPIKLENHVAVADATATKGVNTWGPVSKMGSSATTWIDNQSSHTIYYKPENGSGSISIPPHGKGTEAFDGVAAPHLRSKQVIKAVTGSTIIVTNDDYDTGGFLGQSILQGLGGGWMDSAWLWNITATQKKVTESGAFSAKSYTVDLTPDHGWLALFRSSGLDVSSYERPHTITEYTNNLNGPK